MLPETILFVGGGTAIVLVLLILAIGLWSHYDDKPKSPERPPSDYDDAMKYMEGQKTVSRDGLLEVEEAFDPCNHPEGHAYDHYSDSELFEMFQDHKYGKIIDENITWIENELARRLAYEEIKKETKEEKALARKIASHFRTTN